MIPVLKVTLKTVELKIVMNASKPAVPVMEVLKTSA